jgi:drug/metabolite transporter (DMT)-like permease
MVFSFALLLSLGAGVLAIPGWVPLVTADWPLFVGVGLTGAVAQGFITNAFRHAPASVVTPFEYTALVWGVILDLTIWHVLPSGITLLGGSIVIAAGLYIILRERNAGAIAAHP